MTTLLAKAVSLVPQRQEGTLPAPVAALRIILIRGASFERTLHSWAKQQTAKPQTQKTQGTPLNYFFAVGGNTPFSRR